MIKEKLQSFFKKAMTIILISQIITIVLFLKQDFNLLNLSFLFLNFTLLDFLIIRFYKNEFQNKKTTIEYLKKVNPYEDLTWDEILEKINEKEKELYRQLDITRTENRLFKLLNNSFEDPVFVINKKLDVVYSNDRFEKKFHFSLTGYPYSLLEAIRNLELQNFIEAYIKNQKINELWSSSIDQNENNTPKHYYIKIIPIKFTDHLIITFKDITDKKLAEIIREEFVANFSHEVRTPLTILLAEINQLKNDLMQIPNFKQEHIAQFENIENNSKRLINLFEDILKLSEIETSKIIHKENFDILPLIDSILFDLKKQYPQKNIGHKLHLESEQIIADYKLLELILYNLIENSIKYSSDELNIDISLKREKQYMVLEIKDDGIGISEDQQNRVFERFYRADNSRSQNVKGTGLGLAIVKHIMINHRGKIKLESKLDHGTMISLYFPT